jgi:hypothetical protein
MPKTKSRLTTVTGQTRREAEEERRRTLHQANFPALRSRAEAARHAAMPSSPSGMVGEGQLRQAVSAAVNAVHDFYRDRLGDEDFLKVHRVDRGFGPMKVPDGTITYPRSTDQEPLALMPDGVTYRSAQGGTDDAEAIAQGQPRVEGPNVEGQQSFRRIGNRVALAVAAEDSPAAGTLMETPDVDPRPIGVVTKANVGDAQPTPLALAPREVQEAAGLPLALEGSGIADQGGRIDEPDEDVDDEEDADEEEASTQDDGGGVVGGGGGKDGGGILSRVKEAAGALAGTIRDTNQPASGQAGAGTSEEGDKKEAPPTTFKCPVKGCGFEAGSERGLKAHTTAKHKA